jgi:hypothetical protein
VPDNDDVILVGANRRYHLTVDFSLQRFVNTELSGLTQEERAEVVTLISSADANIRDEFAQAVLFMYASRSNSQPYTRLVISAHHYADNPDDISQERIWGEQGGLLLGTLLRGLTIASGEANAVEDLSISACNAALPRYVSRYRIHFPELRTVFAYYGKASTGAPAANQLRAWEQRTRGETEHLEPQGIGGRRSENIMTWSRERSGPLGAGEYRASRDAAREVLDELRRREQIRRRSIRMLEETVLQGALGR